MKYLNKYLHLKYGRGHSEGLLECIVCVSFSEETEFRKTNIYMTSSEINSDILFFVPLLSTLLSVLIHLVKKTIITRHVPKTNTTLWV